jgi:hypothetical protein
MKDPNQVNPLVFEGLLLDDSVNILSAGEIPEEFKGLTLDEIALIVVQKMDESIKAKFPPA